MSDLWRATPTSPVNLSESFISQEFAAALKHLKPGKAPSSDSIFLELITHAGAALKSWLCNFLSSCLRRLKILKVWRRALVVVIPKPKNLVEDPRSYRPISLLCVSYKILRRFIHPHVEPIVDPLLPMEQAGFQRGRSTVDQTVLITQNIEGSLEAKKKAGTVFVDLTAAYDTVWHRGLTCKLLRLLLDKHMVRIIMELVRNRSFTLTTGDSKQRRLRCLQNNLPQELILTPILFNIYTYAYADDLALLNTSRDWKAVEDTLSQDMTTLSAYYQTWRLKLSNTKTATAVFRLNNREAKRELNVYSNGNLLLSSLIPTYHGVKLDRPLTFRHHLEALRKKLSTRVALLRRLAGSRWVADAKTLRISALSLVYSTTGNYAPVWCRSMHTHLIDSILNDALRIVTGCLRSTPTEDLPVLAGIQPAELRRLGATLSLTNCAIHDPDHVLHGQLVGLQDAHLGGLRSRCPFVPAAWRLLSNLSKLDIRVKQSTKHKWNADYLESTSRVRDFLPRVSSRPLGMSLLRTSSVKLKRLQISVGRFHSSMCKGSLAPSSNCECGVTEQTADHVISSCLIHHLPRGPRGLQVFDDET